MGSRHRHIRWMFVQYCLRSCISVHSISTVYVFSFFLFLFSIFEFHACSWVKLYPFLFSIFHFSFPFPFFFLFLPLDALIWYQYLIGLSAIMKTKALPLRPLHKKHFLWSSSLKFLIFIKNPGRRIGLLTFCLVLYLSSPFKLFFRLSLKETCFSPC